VANTNPFDPAVTAVAGDELVNIPWSYKVG
jgi:hypothetical protein